VSNYRDLWGEGKAGLIKLIEQIQLPQMTELVPKESSVDRVVQISPDGRAIVTAVDNLFKIDGYGLRISGKLGWSDFYIELENKRGEVWFNRFLW
jgi:hypothetical protein